jgi:protease-4
VIRGADAVKINLVDKLGNLNDAIEGAKELADSRK